MHFGRLIFAFTVAAWCVGVCAAYSVKAQSGAAAHRHAKSGDTTNTIKYGLKITQTRLSVKAQRQNIVRSRNYEAFTVLNEKSGKERIFFADRRTGKIYEIRGVPLAWRQFSDLQWQGNRTLVFDRWANPTYGAHYEIDARTRKLKKALVFTEVE